MKVGKGMSAGRRFAMAASAVFSAAAVASAANIEAVPCMIISGVWDALTAIGPSLIAVMFFYGVAKYAYSADDPGGRKQGKTIIIHAVIGGILMGVLASIVSTLGLAATDMCSGINVGP
jgi:hypothetical protein